MTNYVYMFKFPWLLFEVAWLRFTYHISKSRFNFCFAPMSATISSRSLSISASILLRTCKRSFFHFLFRYILSVWHHLIKRNCTCGIIDVPIFDGKRNWQIFLKCSPLLFYTAQPCIFQIFSVFANFNLKSHKDCNISLFNFAYVAANCSKK